MNRADEANELNPFFKRFISHDFSRRHRQIRGVLNRASAEDDDFQKFRPSEDEVRRAFQHVTPNKATGLDVEYSRHALTSLFGFFVFVFFFFSFLFLLRYI